MIEMRVQSLDVDQGTKSPVVVLREIGGHRILPIWIGPAEASSIAMELSGVKFARPLTHDLAASLIRGLGGMLTRVLITRVQENTYFAELVIQRGSEIFSIDARPSDSIAIALRMGARLFTREALLSSPSTEMADDAIAPEFPATQDEHSLSAEQLQAYLRRLNPEDLGRFNP